ncbi:hypothetical protein Tco_0189346 [Tanacetum coccineum]
MLSFLKRYNGINVTHDPKSAKVSKGFESPNLQGKVNSPGSSILVDTSPWTNDNPFLPSSKLSMYLSILRYRLERGIGLREPVGVTKIVLLGLKSVPLTSRFVDLTWGSDSVHLTKVNAMMEGTVWSKSLKRVHASENDYLHDVWVGTTGVIAEFSVLLVDRIEQRKQVVRVPPMWVMDPAGETFQAEFSSVTAKVEK